MSSELHDWNYPNESPQYDIATIQTAIILDSGLCFLAFYYLIVRPFGLFDSGNPKVLARYDTTGLPPRSPMLFRTWRDYENLQ